MSKKATEFVQFKLRVREGLRKKLEREAEKKDHSTNNEAVERLEKSFGHENVLDAALGGPGLRLLALELMSSFALAGEQYAGAHETGPTSAEWLKDQSTFREASLALIISLLQRLPDNSPDELALTLEALRGRLATRLIADGKLRVVLKEEKSS